MKLFSRLIWMGSAAFIVFLTAPRSSATVLTNLGGPADQPQVYSPQGLVVTSVSLNVPQYTPTAVFSPDPLPSSQPTYNEYNFVNNPQISEPSAFSVPSALVQQNPMYFAVPSGGSAAPSSPVSLLYTGPQTVDFGSAGAPILFNGPNVMQQSNLGASTADLFTASDPVTDSPQVTTAVSSFAPRAVAAFSPVPEPRFLSVIAVAAALGLGIVVAKRRQKEA